MRMTLRVAWTILLTVGVFSVCGASYSQEEGISGDGEIRLNFRGVSLDTVLDYFSKELGFIIVREAEVTGRVDVWSHQPITKEEAVELLGAAQAPVILGGVEVHRFGLRALLEELIEKVGYPVATALMGKSVIDEMHAQYIGLYCGALSEEYVRRTVESADCILSLGAWMSDINLGIYTANIDSGRMIHATGDRVRIKHHYSDRVYLGDFIEGLTRALPSSSGDGLTIQPAARSLAQPFQARLSDPITVRRFFERVNHFLDEESVVLADAGDSFLCAGELVMHEPLELT